jgi:hypothetical protein
MNRIELIALTSGLMLAALCPAANAQGNMNMQQQPMQQAPQQAPQQQYMQQQQMPMAQQQPTIRQNAMSKSTWYNAPHEIQITDERPVVRDFREAPSTPGSIALPLGPGGNAGVLPGNGLQLGNGGGYRTPEASGPIGLPKSGFNSGSNIPASLMRPAAGLAKGQSTGTMGRMGAPKLQSKPAASPAQRIASQTPARAVAPQQLMKYGQPGGQSYGSTSSGNSTVVKSGVSGKLMNRIK